MAPKQTPSSQTATESSDRIVINEDDLKNTKRQTKKSTSSKNSKTNSTQSKKKAKKSKPPRSKKQKIILGCLIALAVLLLIGLGVLLFFIFQKPAEETSSEQPEFTEPVYSILSGREIPMDGINYNPTFCVQIPNGNDGGRPQAGLTQADIIFEAIAEAGITRFAAIFQNAGTGAIGPIRSLRPYYLDWDTPFDCTIVHAGGSDEAMNALRAGGQRDLNENLSYMWREQNTGRGWNNLFTSPTKMREFNEAHGYNKSHITGFPHLTPTEAEEIRNSRYNLTENCNDEGENCEIIVEPAENTNPEAEAGSNSDASEDNASEDSFISATRINLRLGNSSIFNIAYNYDPITNSYPRSYANGEPHLVYDCPSDLTEPNTKTDCGDLVQLTPNAVIAMVVKEKRMADNYHEDITTLGSGTAYIFQNGEVIEGTWTKNSQKDQISFRNQNDNVIKLTPGQLWITAVPEYGGVTWE